MSSMGVVREFTTFLAVWLVVTSAPASTATNTTSTPPSTVLDNLTPSAEAVSTTEGEVVTPFFVSDTTKGSNDSVIIENTSIDTTKTNDDIIENTSTDTTKTNNDIIEDIIEDISTDTTKTNNDIIENTSTDTTKTNNDIIENTLTDTTKTNNDIIENTSTDTTKTNDDIIENTSTDTTKTNTDIIENTSTNTTPPTSTTSHDLYDEPTDTTPSSTVPDADYDLLYEAQRVYKQLHGIIHNSDSFKYRIPPFRTSIEMYFEPVQVVSVNDGEQSVHLKVFIDLYWTDMSLAWDPLDYQGLDMLEISSDKIWTPRIIIPHAIEKEEIQVPKFLHLSHDGGVRALVPGFVKFLCYLDLEFFPFDEHKCQLAFLESSRNTLLPLTTTSATTLKAEFSTSADWVLLGYNCTQNTLPREDTTFVSCDMRMRRRSTFYVVNLVLPMALTSTMTLAVFLVPVESGEKLSFLVSIFVSTSVFLNFIVDLVPRSMEKTPRINAALIALLCKIILVTGATIYVLHRYNKQQQQQQQLHLVHKHQHKQLL
ncbi:acetylcholine receptor subunit beta-type unc-29 [Aplysia californica]|uniref:Acetylcholine receptor subunit beta-type unc-29 n=1 Tax=Aplysia californica TaxID=6500 RepID=A0ABM1VQG7_APLCA|nr:acetylcholine receptor subunit beta-type unc-29 [Aplysia californica]